MSKLTKIFIGFLATISFWLLVLTTLAVVNKEEKLGSYFNEIRITDSWGDEIGSTMLDQLMVAEPHRLSGGVFNGTTPDTNFYIATTTANGTTTISNSLLDLATTADSGSSAKLHSGSLARYVGANMNAFRSITRLGDIGAVGNTRQWGVINGSGRDVFSSFTDGFYFQLSTTTFSICSLTVGVQSCVSSGSFNGEVTTWIPDINFHTYEILYTNKRIDFYIDKVYVHGFTQTTSVIAATRHFKPFSSNVNTGVGSVTHLYNQVITISRYGSAVTQAKTVFQAGTTAGILAKNGPGAIHKLIIANVTVNSVITIYDGLSTAGTVLWTSGTMESKTSPYYIDLDGVGGMNFETGFFFTITGANANLLIKFE